MNRLDLPLWFATLAIEVVLAGLLVRGRTYRLFPIFSLYMAWAIVSDLIGMGISTWHKDIFLRWFLYEMPLDCLLQFGVLVELAWSVLRPMRSMLPRWTVVAICLLILLAGAAVWPIAGFTQIHGLPQEWHLILRLRQTSSILQVLFFVVLAAGSQVLSLSWHDRELQVATGLGFYSLVNLVVSLLHAQMPRMSHYHRVDQLLPVSYFCALVYWAVSFMLKEAPRQEFSPQMQSFLLSVSGVARANRMALQENTLRGDRRP
jgi:hypothetical protein